MNRSFWNGRRVLLTGHTGFKGAWAAVLLADMGAEVTAFSLPPETDPSLWHQIEGSLPVKSQVVDLRDSAAVAAICETTRPQLVLHMAAQAQVREGYRNPAQTFFTNIMGTVNLLEALRAMSGIEAILVVTSDKVYANDESGANFSEDDALGGADPYSASKGGGGDRRKELLGKLLCAPGHPARWEAATFRVIGWCRIFTARLSLRNLSNCGTRPRRDPGSTFSIA
jgi:CDP-glucose 4,6-dehydratase